MRRLALTLAFSALLAQVALACGGRNPRIPTLNVAIDELLPEAPLSKSDREKVTALREKAHRLQKAGDEKAAREIEEQAMRLLGYRKAWLRCGPGTFMWLKSDPPPNPKKS
jgi:hypothetical protein